jgi:hypothetical protein
MRLTLQATKQALAGVTSVRWGQVWGRAHELLRVVTFRGQHSAHNEISSRSLWLNRGGADMGHKEERLIGSGGKHEMRVVVEIEQVSVCDPDHDP